jgi:multiple sugar transport system substrate-binding protein
LKKLLVCTLAVLILVSSTLVGCSNKKSSSGSDSNAPVTLNVTTRSAPEVATFAKIASSYMMLHPNVKINITQLGTSSYTTQVTDQLFAKSTSFDLCNYTNDMLGDYAAGGVVADLTPYLNNKAYDVGGFSKSAFVPSALTNCTYKNKIYALPYGISTYMLYYRKDLISNPPKTWDDFLTTAKQFTKSINPSSPTQYGAGMTGLRGSNQAFKEFMPYLWSMGGDMSPTAITSSGSVKAMTFWQQMFSTSKVVPSDATTFGYTQTLQAIQNGEIAMAVFWDAAAGTLMDQTQSPKVYNKIGVTTVPGAKQADGSVKQITYTQNWAWGINQFSKNKDAAFQFLAYYNTPSVYEAAMQSTDSTALSGVMSSDYYKTTHTANYDAYMASMKISKGFATSPYTATYEQALDFAISQVLSGQATPDQALATAQKSMKSVS